jgi:hypothetical protein
MMTDKLRADAQAALERLRDGRLDTWMYMEGRGSRANRDKQAEAIETVLVESTVCLLLTLLETIMKEGE